MIKKFFNLKKRDRVFIIPSLYGWLYGLTIIFTLMSAAIYANNLAYLLCFFLVSLFVVGMHQSNDNLKNIKIVRIDHRPIPAKSHQEFRIWLQTNPKSNYNNLKFELNKRSAKQTQLRINTELLDGFSGQALICLRLNLHTQARGKYSWPRITVSSTYPFGLFYVWKVLEHNSSYWVHPKPLTKRHFSMGEQNNVSMGKTYSKGLDFKEHKKWISGEPLRKIDWKVYAKSQKLYTKEFEEPVEQVVEIHLNPKHAQLEMHLSEVTALLLKAEKENLTLFFNSPEHNYTFIPGAWKSSHKNNILKYLSEVQAQTPSNESLTV